VNFEEYLLSKKIDARAFEQSEEKLFNTWREEFEQMHPNSFTVQKLNLINPIRRKYRLQATEHTLHGATPAGGGGPVAPRPVIKPKPKIS